MTLPTARDHDGTGEQDKAGKNARRLVLGAVLAATALTAAGCGGGSSGTGIDVAQAKKDLAAVLDEPDTISLTPIGKEIPKGKTISYMTCPVAVCTEVGNGVKQAAEALGWSIRIVQNDQTPTGYKGAWDQITQNPSDGVVNGGPILPYSAVQAQLDQAKVPVISSTEAPWVS